ncbi:tumor necrosis factor ligand superfamily member 10-like, partial [Gracilinanus agilis]|uniref:tumor necrosis factor ligand superfamily member 10-like n=1 Tax=Gracilinanus agilis TaxID=191870 RepID=UPI001CFCE7E1
GSWLTSSTTATQTCCERVDLSSRHQHRHRHLGPIEGLLILWRILTVLEMKGLSPVFEMVSETRRDLRTMFEEPQCHLKIQSQGIPEELKCLQLISSLQENPKLEELINNQTCLKLMSSIKSYVGSVTENLLRRSFQKGLTSNSASMEGQPPMTPPFSLGAQPSAHITLIPYGSASVGNLKHLGELPQSCRYPLYNWESGGLLSHLRNVTFKAGVLRISQGGKYYVYSQVYFRYPAEEGEGAQAMSQQLVQCISRQTAYRQPILLLKGVATKCWAPEAEYGLHTIYQGGLFELEAGDELLVSVSSLAVDDTDGTSSYFGAFRLAV